MATPGKVRQRKWQQRQKSAGKQRFTVLLDKHIYRYVKEEKRKTGETYSAIVNRIIGEAAPPETSRQEHDQVVSDNTRAPKKPVSGNVAENTPSAIKRVVAMMGVVGLSAEETAERLNEEGLPSITRGEKWHKDLVARLYQQAVKT